MKTVERPIVETKDLKWPTVADAANVLIALGVDAQRLKSMAESGLYMAPEEQRARRLLQGAVQQVNVILDRYPNDEGPVQQQLERIAEALCLARERP